MRLISLLIVALIIALLGYYWFNRSFSQTSSVSNLEQVNREVNQVQQKTSEYDQTMQKYQQEIEKNLNP